MKLELFNWFPCHAHSWGVSLVQLLAFFTRWKNRNLKCQRRAADEKLISNSGGVRLCVTVCAVWAERRERLHVAMYHSQPPPASEGTSLLPSCLSRFPQLGLEGRAGEERGLFSQRLERHKLGLCQVLLIPATVKCMKVCCFQRASSMFLFLPDLRGVILASADSCLTPWLRALTSLSPSLSPPMPWSTFCSLHTCALPWNGERKLPNNHHEDDFGGEWSCVNCKKHTGVSSTAICVFSKACFCCSGVLAALAQLVACLVNFLLQLLKVCSLLLHWWCY